MAGPHNGLEITPDGVRSGAQMVDDAASTVHEAHNRLAGVRPEPTIFGGNERAQAFGRTLDSKRDEHVRKINGHRTNLQTLSKDANAIANSHETVDQPR